MSVANENVYDLIAAANKLIRTINEAVSYGFLTDGGTLQTLCGDLQQAAVRVEDDLAGEVVEGSEAEGPADHLEAQYENDLGDVS